jgi:hypothetical protein
MISQVATGPKPSAGMRDVGVERVGGVCALLGACTGIIGSGVGAAYGGFLTGTLGS